jgi:ATP-dependent DNA ligase
MLAQPGTPFDSDDFLFELKWDGTRALAFIEPGGFRLLSRQGLDRSERYPELAGLADGPAGTVLDGEIVVIHDGQPDFRRLQTREQTRTPLRIRLASQACPVTYMVFDLLYEEYRPLLADPLIQRREHLERLVATLAMPRVIVSAGIVGAGRALFEEICRRGLEGMVAKRLSSRYQPGKRSQAWRKIKPRHAAAGAGSNGLESRAPTLPRSASCL